MTRWAARALVVGGIVALALVLRGRGPDLPKTPEAAVNALFDAAERGDDEAYLALLTGRLERSLRSTRSQVGVEAFREELRLSAGGVRGLAFTARQVEPDGAVRLDVEIVFADRHERQRVVARRAGGGWVIAAMGSAAATRPAVRYGAGVGEE